MPQHPVFGSLRYPVDTVLNWVDALRWRLDRNRKGSLAYMAAEQEKHVVSRTPVVGDGLSFLFVELDSGVFHVYANRRTKPFLSAFFLVGDLKTAENWRDNGVVPEGETYHFYEKLQAGTWPEPLPGSG